MRHAVSVYKNDRFRERVRRWCVEQLDAGAVDHARSEVTTPVGVTSMVTASPAPTGGAPSIVLVQGTNLNAAMSLAAVTALSAGRHTGVLDVPGQPGLSGGQATSWTHDPVRQLAERSTGVRGPVPCHNSRSLPRQGHRVGLCVVKNHRPRPGVPRRSHSPQGQPFDPAGHGSPACTPVGPTCETTAGPHGRPGSPVPESLATWTDTVATCCHSSLAPAPLPAAVLSDRRATRRVVMTGRHDVFLPPWTMRPAARRGLGVGVHVVESAGHLLMEERPDAVAGGRVR